MKIHKEGYKILVISFTVLCLLNVVLYLLLGNALIFYPLSLLLLSLFLLILNFFRSPKRVFPHMEKGIVSCPADGTIVVIEEVMENEYFHDKRLQVSIFMNVLNVHINWMPISGKILHSSHQKGRFMAAYLPKSSTENERSTVVIETPDGIQILARQVAGALAKRIVTYPKEGQECQINQQMGFIKFGSRVDIYLPLGSEILVEMEQKVRGNITAIARLS